ncbi:MAG: phage holin family protein [Syntrophobacterales bacterium]|nr:phage holin family protein [Syntrophobacterales bacterium]
MHILLKWLVMTVSIALAASVIPGVMLAGFWSALWVALFLGIVNALLRPIFILITLPINILTFGLFTFVINATLVLLVSSVIKGFHVSGFWAAMFFSVVLSIINYILSRILETL